MNKFRTSLKLFAPIMLAAAVSLAIPIESAAQNNGASPALTNQLTFQTPTGPATITGPQDVIVQIANAIQNNDTNKIGYYNAGEIELKLGGAYAQNTGQGAIVDDLEYYWTVNWGVGGQVLNGSANGSPGILAGFAYGEYRKPIGNAAFGICAGQGYDNENSCGLGVVMGRIYYRFSPHLGSWAATGYGFDEQLHKTGAARQRGAVAGAGVSYSF